MAICTYKVGACSLTASLRASRHWSLASLMVPQLLRTATSFLEQSKSSESSCHFNTRLSPAQWEAENESKHRGVRKEKHYLRCYEAFSMHRQSASVWGKSHLDRWIGFLRCCCWRKGFSLQWWPAGCWEVSSSHKGQNLDRLCLRQKKKQKKNNTSLINFHLILIVSHLFDKG